MHEEALDKNIAPFFSSLSSFPNFYLGGGTALALQIGHRISKDLDLFFEKPIDKGLLTKVKKVFAGRRITLSVNTADELTIFIDGAKLTFLYYPFSVLLGFISYNGINLLSIKEIAITKMYAIGRRGEFKDYVDLYYILKENHAQLEELLELSQKKYGSEFNTRLLLEQVVYLVDLEEVGIIFLKKKVTKEQIQYFLEKQVEQLNF